MNNIFYIVIIFLVIVMLINVLHFNTPAYYENNESFEGFTIPGAPAVVVGKNKL